MATIIIQLDPAKLTNPDTDIRYVLPDLLIKRSSGLLTDGGYDYAGDAATPVLLLFLSASDAAIPGIIDILKSQRVLQNDLSEVPVGIQDGDQFQVVHPPDFRGTFQRPGGA